MVEPSSPSSTVQGEGGITVISGANLQTFPLAGMTIGHARSLLEPLVAIHPDAPILVNGRQVESDYALQTGDTLEFVHHAGEKGQERWEKA
jgi:hypothetical protein